jgi:hypothetical protein
MDAVDPSGRPDALRLEVAAVAARLVADDGLDFASAKHKALRQVFGDSRPPRNAMPDNEQLEAALREHLALFDDAHPQRLARMRETALALMDRLARFQPMATGAVWKGLATEHAPIHLQLFHDNAKEVQFFLLDAGADFDTASVPHFRTGEDVEAYVLSWRGEPVLLSVYAHDDLRGALKGGTERGDARGLQALLEATPR